MHPPLTVFAAAPVELAAQHSDGQDDAQDSQPLLLWRQPAQSMRLGVFFGHGLVRC